jgi:type VI secretion system secreted protein VgrG
VIRQVSESAVVVGPEGQEIFTDPFGRVKVQFHWDREGKRNEQSSCWMRVMQPWAGTGWGFQFIPRIGMEVVVNFLGGDQDRPVVMGCLYNAKNPVPHGLPSQMERSGIKTRTTPGGGGWNEIAFDDRAGAEQLYLRAERNLDEEVGLDRTEKVSRNSTETVGADLKTRVGQHRHDETAGDHRTTINGGRSAAVAGRDSVQVGGPRTAAIAGTDVTRVGGSVVLEVDGSRNVRLAGGDTLSIKGDRTVTIDGDDARDVLGNTRLTFSKACAINAAAGVQFRIGTKKARASAEGSLSGDLVLRGGGAIELTSESRIRFRVGKTVLTLDAKGARIEAETISLSAKSIKALGEDGALSVGKEVTLSGSSVKLASKDGAILELDKEARLDGKAVKIKPGLAAEMAKQEERDEQAKDLDKAHVKLFDLAGELITDAPYEVSFFGYLDQGVAADGTVEIPAFPDVEKAVLRWGRPKDKRQGPSSEEPYEYTMDVYLKAGDDDANESLRRKLHNMGHQAPDLSTAIRHYQDSIGVQRTGSRSDVEGDVASRHDAVNPVKIAQE